jgi:hypothetical protein
MPLSHAAERTPLHRRSITLDGYLRADGLFDIDAQMTDVKRYDFPNRTRGVVAAGTPVHDMWMRLTIDEKMTIQAIEAVTDSAPYSVCPDITPNFQRLVGVTIGAGWRRVIKERLGGVQGCTHLVELLAPIATVAYQTIIGHKMKQQRESNLPKPASTGRPAVLNTCHAYSTQGPIVAELWPEWVEPAAG